MYEDAAGLIDACIPPATAADVDWAVGAYARTLAELGVTSVQDPGGVAPDPELRGGPVHYREMARGRRDWAEADALRSEIVDTRCKCTWECAQADNVLFNARSWPRLAAEWRRVGS